jgi:hypothetical protein
LFERIGSSVPGSEGTAIVILPVGAAYAAGDMSASNRVDRNKSFAVRRKDMAALQVAGGGLRNKQG